MNQRDEIYRHPSATVSDFEFDDRVADVFDDMITRSVPGYEMTLAMMSIVANRFAKPNTNVYDLGCSLGRGTAAVRRVAPASTKIYAVDSSAAMISRLPAVLAKDQESMAKKTSNEKLADVLPLQEDILATELNQASLVILNFTLQFIELEKRTPLLKRIYDALLPGGALILSEKVKLDNEAEQALITKLHHDFKRDRGYSDLEIARKRDSIANRLIPETIHAHRDRLHASGFSCVAVWIECFGFTSLVAVK